MGDYAVHFTFINKTSERLEEDPSGTTAILGYWVDLPQTIEPLSQAVFQIADNAGLYGSEANNAFFIKTNIDDDPRAEIRTYATCPFGAANANKFEPSALEPGSVYASSFRAKSGSGDWQDNSVPSGGHPLYVEYTVEYQTRPYRFTLVKLAAESDQPLRNSRGELVNGFHSLWESDTASDWEDEKGGSYAPNVFAYESGAPVANGSHIDVTYRALDIELIGAEAIMYGSVNGKHTFQTDYFFIKSMADTVETAYVVDPASSKDPFTLNADVEWSMQLRQPATLVQAVGPYTTRLELYWLGENMHPAFWNGIPVGFLRSVFSEAEASHDTVRDDNKDWYENATINVFSRYNKRYDTCNGASAFGMTIWGGIFAEEYYRAVAPGSNEVGTLYRTVNCFDQAGMLELVCSLGLNNVHLTSWLLQQPFGFIKQNKLVGIVDDYGALILVNNPFFGTDKSRALVDNNDAGRTWFGCHVYVGYQKPFDRQSDPVYDACAGPTTSNNAADYLSTSRQDETDTQLYAAHNTYPGRVDTIEEGSGVTGVNGQPYQPGGPIALYTSKAAAILTDLVGQPPESFNIATTHVDWAHVDAWVSDVLGAGWGAPFKSVTAGEGGARAFWHLAGADGDVPFPVRVSVAVESVVSEDGTLDMERSAAAVRSRAAEVLLTTERDPEAIWEGGALDQYGDYSLQYKPGLGAGRIVVVAANTVVDIAGGVSTEELEPTAQRLLERVVRHDAAAPRPPVLREGRTVSLGGPYEEGNIRDPYDHDSRTVGVRHAGARLALEFDVDGDISVAGASSPGGKVLLDTYAVEGSGGQSKVRFVLVPRESGTHTVSLHVADDMTMATTTHEVTIHVD